MHGKEKAQPMRWVVIQDEISKANGHFMCSI